MERSLWKNAAKHHNGGGLEDVPDIRQAAQYLRRVKKANNHEWHGAMTTVMTAGAWTRDRIEKAGIPIDTNICQRCGANKVETDLHRCWECEANDKLKGCESSNNMKRRACLDAETRPSVWLRGIIPSTWTAVPPPPEEEIEYRFGAADITGMCYNNCYYGAGDASGGKYTSDPRRRRVSWGVVIANAKDGIDHFTTEQPCAATGFGGNVVGKQSVNRGEATALLKFLQELPEGASAFFITDSSYVFKGTARVTAGKLPSTHKDLWRAIRTLVENHKLTLFKIESHVDADKTLARCGSFFCYYLNASADIVAETVEAEIRISIGDAESVSFAENVVHAIRKRLTTVFLDVVSKDQRVRVQRAERVRAKRQRAKDLSDSGHDVFMNEGYYHCKRCHACVPPPVLSQWLTTPCLFSSEQQINVCDGRVQVGHQVIHPSHVVAFKTGIDFHFCLRCGNTARSNLKALASVCSYTLKRAGKDNLSRIYRNLCPGYSQAAVAHNVQSNMYHGNASLKKIIIIMTSLKLHHNN